MTPKGGNHALDDGYDTDTISVTSTLASVFADEYPAEDVLAEGYVEGEGMKYLIKWEGYDIHRCTWEPEANLAETNLLADWEEKKRSYQGNFEIFNTRNTDLFEVAWRRADAAKASRQEKRRKKRIKLGLLQESTENMRVHESDDDAPLISTSKNHHSGITARDVAADHDDDTGSSLFVKEHRTRRKPPLEQSSSSESEGSEDSLIEELKAKSKASNRLEKRPCLEERRASLEDQHLVSKDPGKHPSKPTSSSVGLQKKANESGDKQRERAEMPAPNTPTVSAQRDRPDKPATTSVSAQRDRPAKPVPNTSSISTRPKSSGSTQSASPQTAPSATTSSSTKTTSSAPPQQSTTSQAKPATTLMRRSAPTPIKMVNDPETVKKKSRWATGDGLYSHARFKRIAELHGRNESTPDPAVLQFVNPPLGQTPGRIRSSENLYSLRELRRPSGQDEGRQDISDEQPTNVPPAPPDWEADKIPLTCFDWKNGSCRYKAEHCRFLHRLTDKTAPADGSVPSKYRRPPLTCHYWFVKPRGCHKSADECEFAHTNTGWLASVNPGYKDAIQIDSNAEPAFKKPALDNEKAGPQRKFSTEKRAASRKKSMTCYFFAMGQCRNSELTCKFSHEQTGILANPPPGYKPPRDSYTLGSAGPGPDEPMISHASPQELEAGQEDPSAPVETSLVLPSFGDPKGNEIEVRLVGFDSTTSGLLTSTIGTCHGLKLSAYCYPTNWRVWVRGLHDWGTPLVGEVLPVRSSSTFSRDLDAYEKHLNEQMMGGVIYHPSFTMLIFPVRELYWDFLNVDSIPISSSAKLRFHLLREPLLFRAPSSELMIERPFMDLKTTIGLACKLDFKTLFTWNGGMPLERSAFLCFHPGEHKAELELMTRWLLLHQVEVHTLWIPGSWDCFTQKIAKGGTGVVLAHPDFHRYWELPGFGRILKRELRIWAVGYQRSIYDPNIFTYDCIENYPHGGLIYITDDVFEEKPVEALKIIQWFFAKIERCRQVDGPGDLHKKVDDGLLLWRLATRPTLLDSIYAQCEKHQAAINRGDEVQKSRLRQYQLLANSGYVESEEPLEGEEDYRDTDTSDDDYFPVMSFRKEHVGPYFEALKRSQKEANNYMVDLFAQWIDSMKRDYRHFFVVHTGAELRDDAIEWMMRWKHLEEVMTPEKCIEYFEQPPKGNRFDFFEWLFPEKKDKQQAKSN
ncbi:hypothetical protein K469DRAFT_711489 [Zopfia rhizophila CBS 207.26]|uniref:Chromo domain-containing protein n=1 Tax=Zopfia rhizophila CBS 207.26 TaxID=1314779 RepID=A0A6A6DYT1_9PEZI|nr:hypothetical protein K469DRAFT_711489 [Zopfia rhizophila CBS 207.26]